MTRKELQSLILKRLDELERLYADEVPDPVKIAGKECRVVHETADKMARAGFHDLHLAGVNVCDDEQREAVKTYLSRCLKALRPKRRSGSKASEPDANTPLTVADVATRLRVSRRVAYELLQGGKIPSYRVGRSIRVKPGDLETYIDSQSGAGRPDPLAAHRRPRKPRRL
ncbi:MAG: helix-turn-helix domain-containing protein [Thermoguttaceae bacterium]|jgi:excisionase family DNA binding protein